MIEEWRDINGFEGHYQVSNLGRVKSLNYRNTNEERILKPGKDGGNYLKVHLYKNGTPKDFKIHRLVANTFIPNKNNLPQVNHKDENKLNNKVDNLEWCDSKYNNTYNNKHRRRIKKVGCFKDGKLIKVYDAINDVKKDCFKHGAVIICCQGKRNIHHGFTWKYIE